eukprot:sb/3462867/
MVGKMGCAASFFDLRVGARGAFSRFFLFRYSKLNLTQIFLLKKNASYQPLLLKCATTWHRDRELRWCVIHSQRSVRLPHVAWDSPLLLLTLIWRYLHDRCGGVVTVIILVVALLDLPVNPRSDRQPQQSTCVIMFCIVDVFNIFAYHCYLLQSDPDLVTSSGERVLGTKSSNAVNFLYRGKFILSLNRCTTKSGVTKSGSDCIDPHSSSLISHLLPTLSCTIPSCSFLPHVLLSTQFLPTSTRDLVEGPPMTELLIFQFSISLDPRFCASNATSMRITVSEYCLNRFRKPLILQRFQKWLLKCATTWHRDRELRWCVIHSQRSVRLPHAAWDSPLLLLTLIWRYLHDRCGGVVTVIILVVALLDDREYRFPKFQIGPIVRGQRIAYQRLLGISKSTMVGKMGCAASFFDLRVGARGAFSRFFLFRYSKLNLTQIFLLKKNASYQPLLLKCATTWHRDRELRWCVIHSQRSVRLPHVAWDSPLLLLTLIWRYLHDRCGGVVTVIILVVALLDLPVNPRSDRQPQQSTCVIMFCIVDVFNIFAYHCYLLQSDPDLVTSSGERVLGTKSSNAVNFLYRGKFILSLNRCTTKSGVTKSGSDCIGNRFVVDRVSRANVLLQHLKSRSLLVSLVYAAPDILDLVVDSLPKKSHH